MKKITLLILLIVAVSFIAIPQSGAMSPSDAANALGGKWIMTKTSQFFGGYNMGKPSMLYLRPVAKGQGYFYYEINMIGKGMKFIVKGNKWETKKGEDGADAMIYMYQTHKGAKKKGKYHWKATKTKVGGPVKFLNGAKTKAYINIADLGKFDTPALNSFMNITWQKK